MWSSSWLVFLLTIFIYSISLNIVLTQHTGQNLKIHPKPCKVNQLEGTCMFVWECIRSEGTHIGMCVDSFMFGSCCAHNLTDNLIPISQTIFYRPTKPTGGSKRPRPPSSANRPSLSGATTIHRPHGAGTLVIRPSGIQTQRPYYTTRRSTTSTTTTTTTSTETPDDIQPVSLSNVLHNSISDQDTSSSISNGLWNTHTSQWQMTTQPSFVTKPKPWGDKNTSQRPKPKPSKKPIVDRPSSISTHYTTFTTSNRPSTEQPYYQQKPNSTPLKPIAPPNLSSSSSSHSSSKPTSTTLELKPIASISTSSSSSPSTLQSTASTSTTVTKTTQSTTTTRTTTIKTPIESNEVAVSISQPHRQTISAARNLECGIPLLFGRPETRIVGGKNAPFGRWPWQVSVRRTSFFGFSSTHRCGGAVLNENWIATAGHCVDDLLTTQIRIRVGEYDFSHIQEQMPYTERGVAQKVVHPKYNFFTYEYDLALVKLEKPLEFAAHISPICLPGTDDLLIGQNATVTGWGRLSEGGTLPSVLQEVQVPIVSNDKCKKMFLRAGRHEFIPEIFLCAGHETGGQDSCQGDSGGPLQVKSADGHYFLAGIISWGIGCAEANLPGVCTRISKFVPWILETVT